MRLQKKQGKGRGEEHHGKDCQRPTLRGAYGTLPNEKGLKEETHKEKIVT